MMVEPIFVELKDVCFSYDKQFILDHIRLNLEKGVSYALIGKSGVGKSTLLNLVAGFLKPSKGTVNIDGVPISSPRSNTAMLFQELGLFPWQTVYQAIMMPLNLKKGDSPTEKADMNALIDEMGLEQMKDKYPKELSGGERQRVALARALVGKPDLLLMDEPTSSLDAMTKENIQKLVLGYQQTRRVTTLFITHDIEEAVLLGENILILSKDGTIALHPNPYYGIANAKQQLGFYEKCIEIRTLLDMEKENDEKSKDNTK